MSSCLPHQPHVLFQQSTPVGLAKRPGPTLPAFLAFSLPPPSHSSAHLHSRRPQKLGLFQILLGAAKVLQHAAVCTPLHLLGNGRAADLATGSAGCMLSHRHRMPIAAHAGLAGAELCLRPAPLWQAAKGQGALELETGVALLRVGALQDLAPPVGLYGRVVARQYLRRSLSVGLVSARPACTHSVQEAALRCRMQDRCALPALACAWHAGVLHSQVRPSRAAHLQTMNPTRLHE